MKAVSVMAMATGVILMMASCGHAGNAREKATGGERVRIGTYDSRAVAVAFSGSELCDAWMQALNGEYQEAREAGNQERVAEIEAEMNARQKLLHKQGFSTEPVDNILELIKDKLPEIHNRQGVSTLVCKWDKESLKKHPNAEYVDVTMALVDAFNPNEKQRQSAIQIQQHKPVPLAKVEKISR